MKELNQQIESKQPQRNGGTAFSLFLFWRRGEAVDKGNVWLVSGTAATQKAKKKKKMFLYEFILKIRAGKSAQTTARSPSALFFF